MIDEALFRAILPWILPPFLGAVIGYLTNALAIRMLFRPLTERRFLGIRIPFTPGVIPRQRQDLAESIGRMVSKELLTEDVFSARFSSDTFGKSLQPIVVRGIDRLAETQIASIRSALALDTVLAMVSSLITESRIDETIDWISEAVTSRDHDVATSLVALLGEVRPLEHLDEDRLRAAFVRLWPDVQEAVDRVLHAPAVQSEMAVRARRILHYSLDQLSSFQRLFVSAAQYDRQLEARIPAIVTRSTGEILQALDSPGTRAHTIASILAWIERNRSHTAAELLGPEGVGLLIDEAGSALGDTRRVRAGLGRIVHLFVGGAEEAQQRLMEWGHRVLDENEMRPLGEAIPFLRRRRATVAREAARRIQGALQKVTSTFLGQLDINTVVVDRINALDIERVEGLLLGIIRKHLRWINIFGALLGALIGGVQIALRLVGLV